MTPRDIAEAKKELIEAKEEKGGDWEALGAWAEKYGQRLIELAEAQQ